MTRRSDKALEGLFRELLVRIGDDPERPGLKDTPRRMVGFYDEVFSGVRSDPPRITLFEDVHDQIVVETDIPFFSMCEHHLVPFFGVAHVGYLPNRHVVGLSKIVRIVQYFAARPQVQERLTGQVADFFMDKVKPQGVVVFMRARHLCMEMRGAKSPGVSTVTNAIRGNIDKEETLRLMGVGNGHV